MKQQDVEQWLEHPVTRAVLSALKKHAEAIRFGVNQDYWATGTVRDESRLKVLMFEEVIDQIKGATAERINTYLSSEETEKTDEHS